MLVLSYAGAIGFRAHMKNDKNSIPHCTQKDNGWMSNKNIVNVGKI